LSIESISDQGFRDICYHAAMFGSHLSIAGGLANALHEARSLKLDCVQVFTKNQRQWSAPPLDPAQRDDWLAELDRMKWDSVVDHKFIEPVRVVSHNSYLINMASPDKESWEQSVRLQRVELERCEELHIPLCVAHPGAHLGPPRPPTEPNRLDGKPNRDEKAGLKRIVKALDRLHRELRGYRTMTCLETTVGSGTNLGYDFHHLAWIRERVRAPERIAFCFDTCHVTAAGYDMTTDEKAAAVLEEFDVICGMENLKVVHINDSVGEVGSRKDRHAHIGEGTCGKSCFRAIVNHPRLAAVPKILETPKGENEKGTPWDLVNVRRLRRMVRPMAKSR
jgi:deoxyribonuclease IV